MRYILIVLACFSSTLCFANSVEQLDRLMAERLKTERATAALEQQWQQESAEFDHLITLYQQEKQVLTEKLAQKTAEQDDVSLLRERLMVEQEQHEQLSTEYEQLLQSSVQQVQSLWGQLPTPLQQRISASYHEAINPKMTLSRRYAALIAIVKNLNSFNNTINFHKESMILNGEKWQTEQLFIGLAQAYYRHPDGSEAGVGWPTPDGWQWQSTPALTTQINQAFAIYLQQQAPEIVSLPIRGEQP